MADPLESVDARVAGMPTELRRRLLARAGVQLDAEGAVTVRAGLGEPAEQSRWGFPTNLPPRQRLIDLLQQQQAAAEQATTAGMHQGGQQQPQQQRGGQGRRSSAPVGAPLGEPPQQAQQAQQRPVLLELLQQSRTFQSPDCAGACDAMAEALGVADLHRGLRGSLLAAAPPEAAVQRTRGLLRAALRAAWSQEALRRGVALAKSGDLAAALPCYNQALLLDPGSADALVARGAALANRREWQRASDDLQAALQLQPQHSNALLYLEAVQSKAAAAGVQLEALPAGQDAPVNGCQQQEPPLPPPQQEQSPRAQQRLQQAGGGDAAAGLEGLQGMDVATALHIVASHYKSRRSKDEKRRRQKGEGSKRHKHRHKKKHKKKRQH
ncbi:hypothetical protein ABPG75_008429 [Micractinium tetrahymenae]